MAEKDIKRQLIDLRTKRMGILIQDARMADRRTVRECAEAIGVSETIFSNYESGEAAPTLPELEALAYFLGIPLDHFWGNQILSAKSTPEALQRLEEVRATRNRQIGALLKETRESKNLSLRQISDRTSLSRERLAKAEEGETALSIPELEVLCIELGLPFESLLDKEGPVGTWQTQQEAIKRFLELPPELLKFISLPVNRPYLELASRLSGLSVEKLRLIAEGLLEITY